jgi:serine protease
MKKYLITPSALLLLLFSNISPARAFDPTPPVIDSCAVSPNFLPDSGGSISATVHITSVNGLTGTVAAFFALQRDGSRQLSGTGGIVMTQQSGDSHSGIWTLTKSVDPNLMPGRYLLTITPLRDTVQNSTQGFYTCTTGFVDYGTAPLPTPSSSTMPVEPQNQQMLLAKKLIANLQGEIVKATKLFGPNSNLSEKSAQLLKLLDNPDPIAIQLDLTALHNQIASALVKLYPAKRYLLCVNNKDHGGILLDFLYPKPSKCPAGWIRG